MAYTRQSVYQIPMPANVPVPSASDWKNLQRRSSSGMRGLRMACPCTVKRVSGGIHIGQDDDDDSLIGEAVDTDIDTGLNNLLDSSVASEGYTPSLLETSSNPFMTFANSGAESVYATPEEGAVQDAQGQIAAQAAGAYSSYNVPQTSTTSTVANALNSVANAAGTVASATTPQTTVSTAGTSIVSGISNTALFVGGAIVLMVLASGKRR